MTNQNSNLIINGIANGIESLRSENRVKDFPASGAAIGFNPLTISAATVAFLQAYNSGTTLANRAETQNNAAFQAIGLYEIPAQLMSVLVNATFSNPQTKQTFKISCQRFFRNCFKGKALIIKGDSIKVYTLASDETFDIKGKVIKMLSPEQVAAKKAAADKAVADAKQKALDAEQATLRLDEEQEARKQAENSAAIAAKKVNEEKKLATSLVEKAESQVDILVKQVADLKLQLERAKHESSSTVIEYMKLVDGIKSAKSLKDVKALIVPGFVAAPEFTGKEVVAMVAAQ